MSIRVEDTRTLRLDFGPLELEPVTSESFDDLIARDAFLSGPLPALKEFRGHNLGEKNLRIENTYDGKKDESYETKSLSLLSTAGLDDAHVERINGSVTFSVTPRERVIETYDFGMALYEMIDDDDIEKCHEFARETYYYRDFNYNYDVARQFDPNADLVAVVDSDDTILGIARGISRTPGYYCPFMYATLQNAQKLSVPLSHGKVCEVMGLYREGKRGTIAFKRLMSFLARYASEIIKADSVWTTYDDSDEYTGTYYKRKLFMQDTGFKLVYRDFGGLWNLIMTDRISELVASRSVMFAR